MSNHGSEPFNDIPESPERKIARNELMRDLLSTTGFRGALGAFPEGQLTKTDEGAIQFAIGEKDGKVVIDFRLRMAGQPRRQSVLADDGA